MMVHLLTAIIVHRDRQKMELKVRVAGIETAAQKCAGVEMVGGACARLQ